MDINQINPIIQGILLGSISTVIATGLAIWVCHTIHDIYCWFNPSANPRC